MVNSFIKVAMQKAQSSRVCFLCKKVHLPIDRDCFYRAEEQKILEAATEENCFCGLGQKRQNYGKKKRVKLTSRFNFSSFPNHFDDSANMHDFHDSDDIQSYKEAVNNPT